MRPRNWTGRTWCRYAGSASRWPQISNMIALQSPAAAQEIRVYSAGIEAEHAARRELVGHLVDRLHGSTSAMYEVAVRDMPAQRTQLHAQGRRFEVGWRGTVRADVAGG